MGTCFGGGGANSPHSQTKITLKHLIMRLRTAAPL